MDPEPTTPHRPEAASRPLEPPREVVRRLPLTAGQAEVVTRGREAVRSVLDGDDDRLVIVVGPCSIHDPVAGRGYAERLAGLSDRLGDELIIIMRAYFEKPRTTVGWKGLLTDPGLDGTFRIHEGVPMARSFLRDVLTLGLPVGCEFLDPIVAGYLADAVSWSAIGARTTGSPIHRQMASGLAMPVGFKNSVSGDVQVAVDAVDTARRPQVFPGTDDHGRTAVVTTGGNPHGHLVLRGGSAGPNYDRPGVADGVARLERAGLPPRLFIDASHGNSGKDHRRQPVVVAEVGERIAAGERGIVGLMLESFLVAGRQEAGAGPLVFGQSVTDSCIGWETTVAVLETLASSVGRRREALGAGVPG